MDTLSALFLGLLFLFSTVGNVSGQIPTGKDEHRTGGADTLERDLCYKKQSLCSSFRSNHPCKYIHFRQVCLGVGGKVSTRVENARFVAFLVLPGARCAAFVE